MEKDTRPLQEQPQYLQGQILALQALLFGLAEITTDPDSFRERGLQGLERLKSALLSEPVSDAQILGIHKIERLLEQAF